MPVTKKRIYIFEPVTTEYVGDQIETDKIKGHSKATNDLLPGDHVSVPDLIIREIRDEEAIDPADMVQHDCK